MSLCDVYKTLKADGYNYIARERIGGETAHKAYPSKLGAGYISHNWVYVNRHDGTQPVVDGGIVTIDEAIKLAAAVDEKKNAKGNKRRKRKSKICLCCGTSFISQTKAMYCCEGCRFAVITVKRMRARGFSDEDIRHMKCRFIDKINMFFDKEEHNE